MSTEQQTLTGDTADLDDSERSTHGSMLWCHQCGDWLLRSKRHSHPHELYDDPADVVHNSGSSTWTPSSKTGEDYEESEPREVGGEYYVELHYSATWSTTVTVASEDQAVDAARDQISVVDDAPTTADKVHDDVTKKKTIYEDDDEADDVPGWPW